LEEGEDGGPRGSEGETRRKWEISPKESLRYEEGGKRGFVAGEITGGT